MLSERAQAALAAAWACACAAALALSLPRLDLHGSKLLWTLFQPLAPPLLMLWLWASAVAHWERRRIPYQACFSERDQKRLPHAAGLRKLVAALTLVATTSAASCALLCAASPASAAPAAKATLLTAGADPSATTSGAGASAFAGASATTSAAAAADAGLYDLRGRDLLPLLVPPVMYSSLAAILLLPSDALCRPARRLFVRTLGRVLLPARALTWSDFLLADVMTSLSKSTGDAARAACLIAHGSSSHPATHHGALAHDVTCGPLSWPSLGFQGLAFFLRLIQCVGVWRRGGPGAQALNALKYASSVPALVLTAMENEAHRFKRPFPYRRLWLAVMVANSLYSFYWDVEQDWGMPWITQPGGARAGPLRLPRTRRHGALYSGRWYAWLVASNLVLRFSWAHRLIGDLEFHNTVLLIVALAEVARRYQWAFVRFEKELREKGVISDAGGAADTKDHDGVSKDHHGTSAVHGGSSGGGGGGGGGGGELASGDGGGGGVGWGEWVAHGYEGAPRLRAGARHGSMGGGAVLPEPPPGGAGAPRVHAAALLARRGGSLGGSLGGGGSSRALSLAGDLESGGQTPAASSGGEEEAADARLPRARLR